MHPIPEHDTRKLEAMMAVLEEREFQDNKFGGLDAGGSHTIGEWLLLIESELDEAKGALIKGGTGRNAIMAEITQIGALALAALEQHGIKEINGRSV